MGQSTKCIWTANPKKYRCHSCCDVQSGQRRKCWRRCQRPRNVRSVLSISTNRCHSPWKDVAVTTNNRRALSVLHSCLRREALCTEESIRPCRHHTSGPYLLSSLVFPFGMRKRKTEMFPNSRPGLGTWTARRLQRKTCKVRTAIDRAFQSSLLSVHCSLKVYAEFSNPI